MKIKSIFYGTILTLFITFITWGLSSALGQSSIIPLKCWLCAIPIVLIIYGFMALVVKSINHFITKE